MVVPIILIVALIAGVVSIVVAIIFSLVLLMNPAFSITLLTVLFGFYALLSGIMIIAFSLDIRTVGKDIKELENE